MRVAQYDILLVHKDTGCERRTRLADLPGLEPLPPTGAAHVSDGGPAGEPLRAAPHGPEETPDHIVRTISELSGLIDRIDQELMSATPG